MLFALPVSVATVFLAYFVIYFQYFARLGAEMYFERGPAGRLRRPIDDAGGDVAGRVCRRLLPGCAHFVLGPPSLGGSRGGYGLSFSVGNRGLWADSGPDLEGLFCFQFLFRLQAQLGLADPSVRIVDLQASSWQSLLNTVPGNHVGRLHCSVRASGVVVLCPILVEPRPSCAHVEGRPRQV